MNTKKLTTEIKAMSRAELISAKDELSADSELPKQIKGQIINEINNRLSYLKAKNKPKQEGGFFYSFMDDGEAVSCISPLAMGDFIIKAEPDALISAFSLSAEQYAAMKEKDWEEFV